jgi:hypothetical protein
MTIVITVFDLSSLALTKGENSCIENAIWKKCFKKCDYNTTIMSLKNVVRKVDYDTNLTNFVETNAVSTNIIRTNFVIVNIATTNATEKMLLNEYC